MPSAVGGIGRGGGQSHPPNDPRPPSLLTPTAGCAAEAAAAAALGASTSSSSSTVYFGLLVRRLCDRRSRLGGWQGRLGGLRRGLEWGLLRGPHDGLYSCRLGLGQGQIAPLLTGPSRALASPSSLPSLWGWGRLGACILLPAAV